MSTQARTRRIKEPVSAGTHLLGMLAAIAGLVFLVVRAPPQAGKIAAMAIYGSTLIAMFLTSTLYHTFDLGRRGNRWLKRLDHVAIFFLIAGTYVPVLLHLLDGAWRIAMLSVVGGLAVAGAIFKLIWPYAPRWLGTGLYLLLGWVVVIPAYRMIPRMSADAVGWFAAGGLLYSVGAIVYAIKRPNPWPGVFGFHEIWHLFVLAAAACHYFLVWSFLGLPTA